MTSHDAVLLDKMMESAGELLFSASAHEDPFARDVLKKLAHQLGRLYGETIRACREHDGLRDEVTTTFMCGMAISPNFGREEEPESKTRTYLDIGDDYMRAYEAFVREKIENPKRATHPSAAKAYGYLLDYKDAGGESYHKEDGFGIKFNAALGLVLPFVEPSLVEFHKRYKLVGPDKAVVEREHKGEEERDRGWTLLTTDEINRDFGAEAREEKTPGQLLYEERGRLEPGSWKCWDQLPPSCHIAYENKARAAVAKTKPDMLRQITAANRTQETAPKKCWKCQGSGNMGFTTYVACDAC